MHPNPIFRKADAAANLGFARAASFGVLCVNAAAGPLLAHVPFMLDEAGAVADLHLVRSNPILGRIETPRPAVIAVNGPEGYVSPDWYGLEDQVPTWNYVAVHLRGRLERRPDAELRGVLDRLSAQFEARLAPKPPWVADKMDRQALARMMRMVVPCRLSIEAVDGTWKLGQNKPEAARLGAAEGVAGQGGAALAALMRDPPA